jgi:hypothetical protein
MVERRQLEFFLLRYVPDAVKDEFVNIGVVMVEPGANGAGFADLRFTRDWRRVRCLDPQADVEMLEALEREIRGQLGEVKDRATLLRRLEDSFSNVIQLSPAKGCLAEDPAVEIEKMAAMYLEAAKFAGRHETSGRQRILGKMQEAFEQAGVAGFMNPFPVERYTKPGDRLTFDFGYRIGDEIKLFHAVSLKASVDAAVMLAARYPKIAECILKAKAEDRGTPLLTAVVDDGLEMSNDQIGFALDMMKESRITVSAMADLPGVADGARKELKA